MMGKIRSSVAIRQTELIVLLKVLGKVVLGIPCPGLGSPVQKSHEENWKGLGEVCQDSPFELDSPV